MKTERSKAAREFISSHRSAVLSTLSLAQAGYPFGSLVPYCLDSSACPLIRISALAEHYKNICADARSSLCVVELESDTQSSARATVVGKFSRVPQSNVESAEKAYFECFPSVAGKQLADFFFFTMQVEQIRWIGGFGDIGWISAEDYFAA